MVDAGLVPRLVPRHEIGEFFRGVGELVVESALIAQSERFAVKWVFTTWVTRKCHNLLE